MNASRKALLLGLALAASAITVPTHCIGGSSSLDIDVAPPPVRVEVVPPPRVGFVWAPGYWEWREHAHVWVPWPLDRRAPRLSLGARSLGSTRSALAPLRGSLGAIVQFLERVVCGGS